MILVFRYRQAVELLLQSIPSTLKLFHGRFLNPLRDPSTRFGESIILIHKYELEMMHLDFSGMMYPQNYENINLTPLLLLSTKYIEDDY